VVGDRAGHRGHRRHERAARGKRQRGRRACARATGRRRTVLRRRRGARRRGELDGDSRRQERLGSAAAALRERRSPPPQVAPSALEHHVDRPVLEVQPAAVGQPRGARSSRARRLERPGVGAWPSLTGFEPRLVAQGRRATGTTRSTWPPSRRVGGAPHR
jgi:hypothetical protein